MGLFGKKKKLWDEARVQENKARMHALFELVVEDAAGYQLVYAYSSSIKTSNYILARKTTYTYTSLIVGFRESDMSIVILQTTPELEGFSDPAYFKKGEIKKAKVVQGGFTIYHKGGIMAGYTQFYISDEYDDEKLFAYLHQSEEAAQWDLFWPKFSK